MRLVSQMNTAPSAEKIEVNIGGNNLEDGFVDELAKHDCQELKGINLWGNKISGIGLKNVQKLSELNSLNLYGNPIGDEGVKYIASLQKLKGLNIGQNTGFGLEGIEALLGSKSLETLSFDNSVMNKDIVQFLRENLANSNICELKVDGFNDEKINHVLQSNKRRKQVNLQAQKQSCVSL